MLNKGKDVSTMPQTQLGNLINCAIHAVSAGENCTDLFDVLLRLLEIGGEEVASYLLHRRLIGRLIEFLYDTREKKKSSSTKNN